MATPLFVRRDIWVAETPNMWDPISLGYAKAVRVMQSRPPTDPTSWAYQAAMHGTYQSVPPGAVWNQCQHASWFFPPWHRMYIYFFERIVRSVVVSQGGPSTWALPYWNYSKGFPSNTLPPAFRQATLPDGTPNPLLLPNPRRNPSPAPGINGGAQLPPRATSAQVALGMVNYLPPPSPGFGGGKSPAVQFENATGQLENQPHNIIHDLVGGRATGQCGRGIMSDPMCAALDPIFWLHHSNIDRLWNQWIALGGGRSDPPDSAWRTQQFRFFDENKQPVTMTPAQVLDTAKQLGYKYDNDPPPVARQRFAPAGAFETVGSSPSDPELVAATESGLTLGSQPVTARVPLPLPAQAAFEAASNEEDPSRVLLNIEGIQIDDHPGVVYEIYLNLPEGTDPAEADDHFVGYVTFFGAKHHPEGGEGADEHAPAGLKQTYDITPLVDNLKAQGHWTGDSLAVSFVPQGLLPPPEGAESGAFAEEAPEEESLEQPEVRIGRVSIVRE